MEEVDISSFITVRDNKIVVAINDTTRKISERFIPIFDEEEVELDMNIVKDKGMLIDIFKSVLYNKPTIYEDYDLLECIRIISYCNIKDTSYVEKLFNEITRNNIFLQFFEYINYIEPENLEKICKDMGINIFNYYIYETWNNKTGIYDYSISYTDNKEITIESYESQSYNCKLIFIYRVIKFLKKQDEFLRIICSQNSYENDSFRINIIQNNMLLNSVCCKYKLKNSEISSDKVIRGELVNYIGSINDKNEKLNMSRIKDVIINNLTSERSECFFMYSIRDILLSEHLILHYDYLIEKISKHNEIIVPKTITLKYMVNRLIE